MADMDARERAADFVRDFSKRPTYSNDILQEMTYQAIRAAERAMCERAAVAADNHRCGEVLIRHKMSEVEEVGVVAGTIATAIRKLADG